MTAPEPHWDVLGPTPAPEHLFNKKSASRPHIKVRCRRCSKEKIVREQNFFASVPCACVNLEVQRKKMGPWLKWALGSYKG